MFIKKSTHEAALKKLEASYQEALSRELKHQDELKAQYESQISDLRKLVFVTEPTPTQTLPLREVNAVIDGAEILPKANKELEDEIKEFNRIMGGDYDRSEDMYQ